MQRSNLDRVAGGLPARAETEQEVRDGLSRGQPLHARRVELQLLLGLLSLDVDDPLPLDQHGRRPAGADDDEGGAPLALALGPNGDPHHAPRRRVVEAAEIDPPDGPAGRRRPGERRRREGQRRQGQGERQDDPAHG
jgi:hypothetical protein